MGDLISAVRHLGRIAQAGPVLVEHAVMRQRAAAGDPEAQRWLGEHNLLEIGEKLANAYRPGFGTNARTAIVYGRQTIEAAGRAINGDVLEGEFRVLDEGDGTPWGGFARWWGSRPSGGAVFLGPKGSGKTSKMRKVARKLGRKLGYRVRAVNLYGHDNPGWIEPVGFEVLAEMVDVVQQYLARQKEAWRDGAMDPGVLAELERILDPIKGQIVMVDEASLWSIAERDVICQAVNQARHMRAHVLLAAQYTNQFRGDRGLSLLGAEALVISTPNGGEAATDQQDNRMVRELWKAAIAGHRGIRSSPWWQWYPDPRDWAYVQSDAYLDSRTWTGMLPFEPEETDAVETDR